MAYCILKSFKLDFNPLRLFEIFNRQSRCFFLDSSMSFDASASPIRLTSSFGMLRTNTERSRRIDYRGRYSFLGIEPFKILKSKNGDCLSELKEALDPLALRLPNNDLPFFGGAVGYLAYDLGFSLEKKLKPKYKKGPDIPNLYFCFYNNLVIIDHYKQIFYILSLGLPEKKYSLSKKLAEENFKKISNLVSKLPSLKISQKLTAKIATQDLNSNFTKKEYLGAVKKAKEYIANGDIYQVNLSQQFNAKCALTAPEIYKRLRSISPSYFGAYLDTGDFQIISSSPERFLKLEGNKVTTCPMKGTRPRGANSTKDKKLRSELLKSAKDKAELMMIIDLERNDLGRVCDYDSINVSALREIEEYKTVFQSTATITGRLYKNKGRIDLLRASFPGGSITGCPKIRAMEIIEELEPTRRAIYTGALGYLSFTGDMEMNILIRTILKKEENIYFGVGGGIVADSDPESEYQETLVKAKGSFKAIKSRY